MENVGARLARVKSVAAPERAKTRAPQTTRRRAGSHVATAAALWRPVATFSPRTFAAVAAAIATNANRRKKTRLWPSAAPRFPRRTTAFAAVK